MSRQTKYWIAFWLLLSLTVVSITGIGARYLLREREQLVRYNRLSSQIQAQLLAEHGAAVFRQVELALRALATEFEHLPSQETLTGLCRSMSRTVLHLSGLENAAVVRPDGSFGCVVRPDTLPSVDTAEITALHAVSMLDFHISTVIDEDVGSLIISVRLDDRYGNYAGALIGAISEDYLARRYQEYGTIDVDFIALYDPVGVVLARWPATIKRTQTIDRIELLSGVSSSDLLGTGLHTAETGDAIVSIFQLPNFPYRIVVGHDKHTIFAPWRRQAGWIASSLLILIVTIIVSSIWIRSSLIRQVRAQHNLNWSLSREKENEKKRLESLRALSGGLAHDINNAMMVVLGNVELVRIEKGLSADIIRSTDDIRKAAQRAAAMSEKLLASAGNAMITLSRIDPAAMTSELTVKLQSRVRADIHFVVSSDEPVDAIIADTRLLATALESLVDNAVESLHGSSHGRIELKVSMVEWDGTSRADMVISEPVDPGSYVGFSVCDNGSGMEADILSRLFDPFFTTRFLGRGLGMTAVAGIVRQHSGSVIVQSSIATGTCATIMIPPLRESAVKP